MRPFSTHQKRISKSSVTKNSNQTYRRYFYIFIWLWHASIWLINSILDLYWRFLIWLVISLLLTGVTSGIVANYVYTYITTCTPSKPNSCSNYFSDASKWPIIPILFSYLYTNYIYSIVFLLLFITITIWANQVHRHRITLKKNVRTDKGRVKLILASDLDPKN